MAALCRTSGGGSPSHSSCARAESSGSSTPRARAERKFASAAACSVGGAVGGAAGALGHASARAASAAASSAPSR
eukprot:6715658-Prymnesium_polylepis.1